MTRSRFFFAAFCFGTINLIASMPAQVLAYDSSVVTSLDQEIETLKADILSLNSDFMLLEEELLFPPHSQLSIFLSIQEGASFPPFALNLEINDKPVVQHSYTRNELDAFAKGGIQRLYIGNISQGKHKISAGITGVSPSSPGAPHRLTFKVSKYFQPTLIELRIINSGTREDPQFDLEQWLL